MSEFHFFHPIEVRYGDLDPQGHLNNSKYLTYFETARIRYLVHLGLFQPGESFMNVGIIMADAHIIFKAAVEFGMNIQVGVCISRLGNKSMTSEYTVRNADTGEELARGSSALVAYNYRTGQTIPIPDEWREKITRFEHLGVVEG